MSLPEQISALPLPPMNYINLYTDDNVMKGKAPKPPPPIVDQYTMFGLPFCMDDNIIRPLEAQGIKRLYPQHPDRRKELKKLNHSLLVNFIDLLDMLIYSPDSPKRTEKVEDIGNLFIHIHHLINEFRPHQARETLRVMLDIQKKERIETARRYRKHLEKANEILQQALDNLPDTEIDPAILAIAEDVEDGETEKPEETDPFSDCTPEDRIMCQMVDAMEQKSNLNKNRKRKMNDQNDNADAAKVIKLET